MVHRRLVAMAVVLLATMASTWAFASPNGLGSEANEGCLCHTPDASTRVSVAGLPEAFESSTTYNLTLTISSPIEASVNNSQGGFRWVVDGGQLSVANNSTVQELDGGWTHTYEGSFFRTWDVQWTSPADNATAANFVIHGNAVNGNNAPTEDAWATLELVVPGQAYEGDLTPDEGIDGVSQTDRLVPMVGLVLIAGLLWAVARP
ncbi:MAG: choice-of-anchor V domain-containing protein [Poseidonia sp.]